MTHRTAALRLVAIVCLHATAIPLAGQVPEVIPSEPIPTAAIPTGAAAIPAAEPFLGAAVQSEPAPWLIDLDGYYGFSIARYNRIDGLTPAWGLTLEATEPMERPSLGGRVAAATTHQRLYWSVWAEQRLPLPGAVVARIEHFRRARTFDDWKISIRENDVSTFVAGSDLLDWWREKGYRLSLDAETGNGRYGGSLALLDASQRSEPDRHPFALFAADDDFRENPGVAEGTLRSVTLGLRFDTRDVQSPLLPAPGWSLAAAWERAGGALGGDVTFSRAEVDLRRYTRLGRDTWWDARLVWMGPLTGTGVPPQRKVSLGGPGSLRGFRAASFVASEGVQAATELRVPLPVIGEIALLFLSWHAVGFLDVGSVGDYEEWHADVGAGVSGINIFSYLGFFVAQRVTDLDDGDSGPQFIVRLRRDF
ncbi:MAG TPA: BamA/TamA family outer membrane protein [Gemmatimonadota bacterium]|nr:BamA/TamA family outer membrane protein [Gemmatimonadota bacterium]